MYLNCKTVFSFRYGTFKTHELVAAAVENGVTTLALTNINSTCDAWDFVELGLKENIKPVLGAEIRNGDELLYILIARNNNGFARINEFLSENFLLSKPFPANFDFHSDVFVIYPLGAKDPGVNGYIGILPSEVNKLFSVGIDQTKLVIRQPVTFQNKTFYNVHRLLRCIDKNVLLSKLPATSTAQSTETFLTPRELIDAFSQYPSIITNTYKLLDQCSIEMEFHTDKNKKHFSASGEDDRIFLRKLAYDGFDFRYGANKNAQERLEKELRIIDELSFNAYFLITWDIIRYAQGRGFYYVGRGSGANSIVAYCLQITDVDPIELNLYFERFLNPHRTSPPDFDIDFSWLDRDEVIDYVFKRYGKNHVALLGMYSTFQYRAVVRELGKVFGLPKEEIDQLAGAARAQDKIHKMILQ